MTGPVEPVADTEAVEVDGLVEFMPYLTSQHEHDGTCGRDHDSGWTCTRVRGHHGNHEAGGGGSRIYASWPNVVSSSTREEGETDGTVRAVCSGGGPSREPGKVLIEFRVDEGTVRTVGSEWLLRPVAGASS
jgi:hypothetical protein